MVVPMVEWMVVCLAEPKVGNWVVHWVVRLAVQMASTMAARTDDPWVV